MQLRELFTDAEHNFSFGLGAVIAATIAIAFGQGSATGALIGGLIYTIHGIVAGREGGDAE